MTQRQKTLYRDNASNRLIPEKVAAQRDPSTWTEEQYHENGTEPIVARSSSTDGDKVWFRSKRIFHTDDGWYIGTREGNLGPFPDRKLAIIELRHYIQELKRQ